MVVARMRSRSAARNELCADSPVRPPGSTCRAARRQVDKCVQQRGAQSAWQEVLAPLLEGIGAPVARPGLVEYSCCGMIFAYRIAGGSGRPRARRLARSTRWPLPPVNGRREGTGSATSARRGAGGSDFAHPATGEHEVRGREAPRARRRLCGCAGDLISGAAVIRGLRLERASTLLAVTPSAPPSSSGRRGDGRPRAVDRPRDRGVPAARPNDCGRNCGMRRKHEKRLASRCSIHRWR